MWQQARRQLVLHVVRAAMRMMPSGLEHDVQR